MIRLEAQNDFLNKERLMLEEKVKAMEEENRTKSALRAEINALREQSVVLKDKIHDYEQLMEQNVQKLERVKKIREKDIQNYEESEKQRIAELAELEDKLDGLEALVQTLTAEKGMLEKKVQNAEQTLAAYSSDKKNFSELIDQAAQQKLKILGDKQEVENRLNHMKSEVMERNNKISKLQSAVEEANKQTELMRQRCAEINQSLDSLRTDLGEEKDRAAQLEIDMIRKQNEIESFTNTKLHYEKRIQNLEESLHSMIQKDKDKRQALEGSSHENSKLEALVNAAKSESEFLKHEVRSYTEQLMKTKEQLEKVDATRREALGELKGLEQKNELLRREKHSINEIIQKQEREINSVNSARSETERQLIELTGKKEALDQANIKLEEFQKRILQLEGERLTCLGEKEQALLRVQKLEMRLNDSSNNLNDLGDQKKHKEAEIGNLKDEIYRLTIELRRKEEELRLNRQVEEDYKSLLSKNTQLEIQLQKADDDRRNHNLMIHGLQKSLESKEGLLSKANEELASFNSRINEEMRNTMSNGQLATQLNEKVKLKELAIDELKIKIAQKEERSQQLESRIIQDEKTLKDLSHTIEIQSEKLRQFQGLVHNLENSKDELIGRLKSHQEVGLTSDSSLRVLKQQENLYKNTISDLERDLSIARDALIQINHERDEMQLGLDEKTTHLESLMKKYEQVFNELAQFKTLGVQKDGQNQQYSFRIEQRKKLGQD